MSSVNDDTFNTIKYDLSLRVAKGRLLASKGSMGSNQMTIDDTKTVKPKILKINQNYQKTDFVEHSQLYTQKAKAMQYKILKQSKRKKISSNKSVHVFPRIGKPK